MKGSVGYSDKIYDPVFSKYLKNSTNAAFIFSSVLAIVAIGGFYYYGETSTEMDNPQALFIGLTIGGMFLSISALQTLSRKRSKTWDGVVVDKHASKRKRKQATGDNNYYWEEYMVYIVYINSDKGKKHEIQTENDATVFNYYNIGDKLRHHGGLNSYEKYDKSQDSIIFCNACATMNSIDSDNCGRCHCPLLK